MKTNVLLAAALATLAAPAFAGGAGAHEAQIGATPDAAASTNVASANATPSSTDADAGITSGAGASVEAVKPTVEVVSRGTDGRADVVNVDGQSYKVCKSDADDSCINPRSAGLNFGARDLQYWPGRPASEISTPLPATPPATPDI